jgi:hypothetical protein
LLIQELQAINVQMHIITEDNIDQIESMSYSDNIQKLTVDPSMTPQHLVQSIQSMLKGVEAPLKTPVLEPEPEQDFESPAYPETSPAFVPEPEPVSPDSMQYNPVPAPTTPEGPPPPRYLPATPEGSPPLEPQMGGGQNQMDQFQLGGQVYYLRSRELGLPSDHMWQIVKKGGRLLTIRCAPTTNLTNPTDYIQIAKCDELLDPQSAMAMKMRQQQMQPPPQRAFPQLNMNPFPETSTPQINVNPVIKIVNGNDNSTGGGEGPQPQENSSFADATFSSLQIQNPTKPKDKISGGDAKPAESSSITGALSNLKTAVIHKLMG